MNKALILFFTERRAIIFPHIEKIVKCKPTQPINGIHKQFLWYFKENNGKVCTDFGYTCQLIRKNSYQIILHNPAFIRKHIKKSRASGTNSIYPFF